MEYLSNSCRLCRTAKDSTHPWNHLFAPHNNQLVKQIRACTGVQITDSDLLPKWICDRCMAALDQAYCFRIQCKETDACLRTELTLLQKNIGLGSLAAAPPPVPVALMYAPPETGEVITEEAVKEEPQDELEVEPIVKEEPQDGSEMEELPGEEPHEEMEELHGEEPQEGMELIEPISETEAHPTKSKPKAQLIIDERRCENSSWNKRVQCRFCPKNFGRPGRLREHEKRHTGGRTVPCLNCSRKFFTELDMRGHVERIHATNLPHGCEKCGKRFFAKSQLICHTRTHAERRDFTCEVCHKSFKNKYYLKYHLGLHEKAKGKSQEGQGEDQLSENDEDILPGSQADRVKEEVFSE